MPNPVNLVRPDGSLIQVDADRADALRGLGYRDESPVDRDTRIEQSAREDYYSGQKLATFAEGVAGGLTFGGSDALFRDLNWDTQERAQYNPGTRIAGDIVGAVLPAVVSGGATAPESAAEIGAEGAGLAARALRTTPAGLASGLAERAAPLLAEGRIGRAVAKGAVEGALYGGGAELQNAELNDDPLTAESIVAGMGWGALYGGALSGLISGAGRAADAYAGKVAAETSDFVPAEKWAGFRSSVEDARKVADTAVRDAEARVAAAKIPSTPGEMTAFVEQRAAQQRTLLNEIAAAGKAPAKGVPELRDQALRTMQRAAAAAREGDTATFERLLADHEDRLKGLVDLTGVAAPDIHPFAAANAKASSAALEELKTLSAAKRALDGFPATAAGFGATSPAKMERHIAAIDALLSRSAGGAEMEGVRTALANSVREMTTASGLAVGGTPATQLRALWESARAARSTGGQSAAMGLLRHTAGNAAGAFAAGSVKEGGMVARSAAYAVGKHVVGGLLGIKAAVLGSVRGAVAKWAPRAARAAERSGLGSRAEPLAVRLDGTVDRGKKDRRALMAERAEEIRRAAPAVRDQLFRAVEPLSIAHPDSAAAIHSAAVAQFDALTSRLPRDPGNAVSGLRSLWRPDDAAIERFARAYAVFQNPVLAAQRMLATGRMDADSVRALRDMAPALYTELRAAMIDRLSEPGVLEGMPYGDQVAIGNLLGVTVNSTMSPRFIAAQQAMYRQRNEPLPTRQTGANASTNPSGGRPPPGATAAERATEH